MTSLSFAANSRWSAPSALPLSTKTPCPALTRDRKDDAVLYTALLADADLLVSDDKHLVPDRHEHHWEHDGHTVVAVTFDTLVSERLNAANLSEIDGSWLAVAHG